MQKILSTRAPDGCYNDSGLQKGSQPQETDGRWDKWQIHRGEPPTGLPSVTRVGASEPTLSESAEAFPKSNEQFSSFLPSDSGILFRTPFFTASLLCPPPLTICLFGRIVSVVAYLLSFPPLFSDTKHHRGGMLTLLSFSQQKSLSVSEVASDSPSLVYFGSGSESEGVCSVCVFSEITATIDGVMMAFKLALLFTETSSTMEERAEKNHRGTARSLIHSTD